MIEKLVLNLKLVLRLLRDRRVNPLLKLIPLFTVLYFVIPDPLPLPFALDDFGVLIVGLYLFVQLCPPEIVAENLEILRKGTIPGSWKEPGESGDVVDVSFKELDPKQDTEGKPPAKK
jgi:hypothetical protein